MIQSIIILLLAFGLGFSGGMIPRLANNSQTLGVATTVGIRQGGTATSSVPRNNEFLIGNSSTYIFTGIPDCISTTTDKLVYNSSTYQFGCSTDQTGAGIESGWRTNNPFVYLTTSTAQLGVGATTTDTKFYVQGSAI